MRTVFLAAALFTGVAAFPASAAERGYSVTDFERIRVDGAYTVTLTTGRSPSARAIGTPGAIDGVTVEVQGRTLIVKRNSSVWGGNAGANGRPQGPVELRLSTHALRSATVNGAGSLTIDRLRGATIDLTVSGSGSIKTSVEADRLNVALVGAGRAEIAGKAAVAEVGVRGMGVFAGDALVAKQAKLGADGPADIRITVTGTASVVSNGAGSVVVLGAPACTVQTTGSGSVTCGK